MTHDLLVVQVPLLEKAIRSVAVYLFLLIVLLLAANRMVVHLSYDRPMLSRLVQGTPTTLIRNGRTLPKNLHRELISKEELLAALRHQGTKKLSDVDLAVLEPS